MVCRSWRSQTERDRHSLLGQFVGRPRLAQAGWSIAIATTAASISVAAELAGGKEGLVGYLLQQARQDDPARS